VTNWATKFEITALSEIIYLRLGQRENPMSKTLKTSSQSNKSNGAVTVETVVDVLECELRLMIEACPGLVPLNHDERTGHLPHLMYDVISRLRLYTEMKALISKAFADH
jgi:hypothetical protein